MSLAMKRLQNIGWLALVFLIAILLYPLSLNVAAVHSDLVSVDGKIRETKREISFLQAEIRTRASLQQLDEWNKVLYGYVPPTAEQFLNGESALAQLDGGNYTIKPVMVSSIQQAGVAPAGVIGSSFAKMIDTENNNPDALQPNNAKKEMKVALAQVQESAGGPVAAVVTVRTQKLANMDDKLISEDLLKGLKKKSDKERKRK